MYAVNASLAAHLNSNNSIIPSNSLESFFLGALFTLISSILIQLLIYRLNKQNNKEERKETFKLALYHLKIQAAQTAYQYIFKVYREQQNSLSEADPLGTLHKNLNLLLKESRDWLDGQALILGNSVYTKVFTYFNHVGYEEQYEKMEEAQKALKAILKKDLINEN